VLVFLGVSGCRQEKAAPQPTAVPPDAGPRAAASADDLTAESVTQRRLLAAANAFDDETADTRVVPQVASLADLAKVLSTRGIAADQLKDGWGRPFEVSMKDDLLEIRSLGRDGVRDQGPLRGQIDDPDADIVIIDDTFEQWHQVRY
jgi:hypothetical protein